MAARRYRLNAAAERDVEAILRHSARTFGSIQRRVYAALIHSALDRIADDPVGLGSKSCDELLAGLRSLHLARVAKRQAAASHVIFYTAERESEGAWSITVVRVLHERMDPERHIPSDPS